MKKKQKNIFGKLKVGIDKDYTPEELSKGVGEGLGDIAKSAKELVPKKKRKRR
ncbi:hypothetical protein KAW18_01440 [candidate division WOR-3 bacterium]|nr:hypothetical protein [candidate division WOR-3 bacterium]